MIGMCLANRYRGTVLFVFVVIETERKIPIPDQRVVVYSPKTACCFAEFSQPFTTLILDLIEKNINNIFHRSKIHG